MRASSFELKRRLPAGIRSNLSAGVYHSLAPMRGVRRLPGKVLTESEMEHLGLGPDIQVEFDRATHRWSNPTLEFADFAVPPRPVNNTALSLTVDDGSEWLYAHNFLLTPDRRVVYETDLRTRDLGLLTSFVPRSARLVPGTVAWLSNSWPTNFYHWMVLTLPLVARYRDKGEEPDWWYVGEKPRSWQLESLAQIGVDADRLLWGEPVVPERVRLELVTRHTKGVAPEPIRWLRSAFGADMLSKGSRRLFVRRGAATTRRFLNEDEAYGVAREFGYEAVSTEGMTLAEEQELFAGASSLLSCHGSGLTNLLFAPRHTSVLELFPSGFRESAAASFVEIVAALEGRHLALEGQPAARVNRKPIDGDLVVEPVALELALAALHG